MFDCVWSPFAALDCAVGSGGRVVVRMQMWMSDAKSVILSYRDVCTCVCVQVYRSGVSTVRACYLWWRCQEAVRSHVRTGQESARANTLSAMLVTFQYKCSIFECVRRFVRMCCNLQCSGLSLSFRLRFCRPSTKAVSAYDGSGRLVKMCAF